jgi:hypothetical protein
MKRRRSASTGRTFRCAPKLLHCPHCPPTPISAEILEWLGTFRSPPRQAFITRGEPVPADGQSVERELGWMAMVPDHGQNVDVAD